MRLRKKMISATLSSMLLFSVVAVPAFANVDNTSAVVAQSQQDVSETTIYEDLYETITRGTKPPSGTALNLSKNNYVASITSLRYGNLFTNFLFSGTTTMSVSIDSISVDRNGFAGELKGVTVTVYKPAFGADKVVASKKIPLNGGSVSFSGLDKSTKYYIEFSKQNDGAYYSFDATIEK